MFAPWQHGAIAISQTPSGLTPTMKIIRSKTFTAERPWGALDIANMRGITTRLHWTDQPYKWHVNDGEEVFAVLDGRVEMRYREAGVERSALLETGDIFYASVGTEHVAHPLGEARILVIESEGSV
jgi:mannose-6-phosphate isomerase-like protein (cupin superfamily)